jgi:hypothetical protein
MALCELRGNVYRYERCKLTLRSQLTQQTQTATQVQYDRAGNAMQMADAEIARFRAILREIDELQTEFDKVRRIGEIVKGFKSRVDRLDRRI